MTRRRPSAKRNKRIVDNLEAAEKIASEQTRRASSRASIADDIRSAALEGLVEAADRYDSTRGVPFNGYAYNRIKGAVLDFLRAQDHVGRHMRAVAKTNASVAESLPDAPIPLDTIRGFADRVPDPFATNPEVQAERAELLNVLEIAATKLPERLQLVLSLHYSDELTQAAIGKVLGVTESRVNQLLQEAHTRMRGLLGEPTAHVRRLRPAGTGSIERDGNRFYWRLKRGGQVVWSKSWPTRALAEAELNRVVADPNFVPALKLPLRAQRKARCSTCHATGHYAPRCPKTGSA